MSLPNEEPIRDQHASREHWREWRRWEASRPASPGEPPGDRHGSLQEWLQWRAYDQEHREWEDAKLRAITRACPEAEARARRNGVNVWTTPIDLLGNPIDPSPAGRRKAEHARLVATGFTTIHPREMDDAVDPVLEQMDDEMWAEDNAPMLRRRGDRR